MTEERQRRGRIAEDYVAGRLRASGWSIVGRNVRPAGARGELDIVAREGAVLAFVEVKARSVGAALGPETPLLAVGPRKQVRLRRLAAAWLRAPDRGSESFVRVRFDVAGIWLGAADTVVRCDYVRDAF